MGKRYHFHVRYTEFAHPYCVNKTIMQINETI